jgi:thymidylate synthase ThyX
MLNDRDKKLVWYLAKHKHLSPFGHAFASFHVKAPIFVARQLVKHKFLRWNEISRRYVDDDLSFMYLMSGVVVVLIRSRVLMVKLTQNTIPST